MNISKNNFSSIEQMTSSILNQKNTKTAANSNNAGTTFQEILNSRQSATDSGALKFSKHANERLASRNIDLSTEQLDRLETGTNKAREKGINESLVMVDNLAFVVSVKNNTVITAVNDSEDTIFTNIDGAVIT